MTNVIVTEVLEPKLLTVKDFCKYINVSERKARTMLTEPNCPYRCKIGGKVLVNKPVLDKWIDSNTGI